MTGTSWQQFLAMRTPYLKWLASTVEVAVTRKDTHHPAFHGCIDWHSAVHGTYALLAVARMTGERQYRETALAALGGLEHLAAEETALRAGSLCKEVPYGMAWVLHLDVEAARGGLSCFHPLALGARDLLLEHLETCGGSVNSLGSQAYRSTIWTADALHCWATTFRDAVALHAAGKMAARIFAPDTLAWLCSAESGPVLDGFFSPSHLAVLLAMRVDVPSVEMKIALNRVRGSQPLGPGDMLTPHSAGLNFSRAWGCYAAWVLTEDPAHRDNFVALLTTHLALTKYWQEDYYAHGHWVAQFGVFALALTELSDVPERSGFESADRDTNNTIH